MTLADPITAFGPRGDMALWTGNGWHRRDETVPRYRGELWRYFPIPSKPLHGNGELMDADEIANPWGWQIRDLDETAQDSIPEVGYHQTWAEALNVLCARLKELA